MWCWPRSRPRQGDCASRSSPASAFPISPISTICGKALPLHIVKELAKTGFEILTVEPNIETLPKELADTANVRLTALEDAIAEADIVVLLVDHKEFKRIPKAELLARVVVDTRGVWAGA